MSATVRTVELRGNETSHARFSHERGTRVVVAAKGDGEGLEVKRQGDISSKTADIHTRMNNNNIDKIESSLGGLQITRTFAGRTT